MSETTTLSVRILDKEYQVSCGKDEVEALTQSARYLDQQMVAIRDSGKVFGLDRIAVMAALNISHEFLTNSDTTNEVHSSFVSLVDDLSDKVSVALSEQKQLSL